jgi:hypothetical protein
MVTARQLWTPAFEVVKKGHRIVTPAQAEPLRINMSLLLPEQCDLAQEWVPAFPRELVRGLKAHGKTRKGNKSELISSQALSRE